jgi:hypothetical protein
VLAEREHIVGQALAVPVLIGSEVEPDAQPTFGVAIRAKLAELSATDERWASWKDDTGWVVKLEFTANDVDHDARWSFDPRRSALAPLNADATQLSRQGSLPEGLIPRLRALDKERPSPYKDETRFDSGAFGPRLVPAPAEPADTAEPAESSPTPEPRSARHPQSSSNAQEAATRSASFAPATPADTADLLEALRRRRGQREARPTVEEESDDARPLALFDALEPGYEPEPEPVQPAPPVSLDGDSGSRKRRRGMPSWDEIVFGARSED